MAMLHLLQVCQTPFLIIVAKQLGMFSKMSTGRNGLISCAFGAILHGYANQEIDTAVDEQRKLGMVFNQPAEVMVDLAEALVEKIDFADWAVFAKNGSDLTTWAIRVAREKTQRKFIVKASGAYHGVDAWCDPGLGGRIASDRKEILEFSWNDLDD